MTQIPELASLPFLGSTDVDRTTMHASYSRLAEIHGEVFSFYMGAEHTIVVNSYDVYNDLCDETRFEKRPAGGQREMRNAVGDGLFTAFNDEENWAVAHRILMPEFGPVSSTPYFSSLMHRETF